MITSKNISVRLRAALLISFSVGVLAWNMALSSRRVYYSGKLFTLKQEDLVLKVGCPGRIEPKVQETVRAILDGPKKKEYVREGDQVAIGQLLMEIGEDTIKVELTTKHNNLRNAQVEYQRQQKEYDLSKRLYRHMAIPKRDLENAEQALERAVQGLQSAKDDLAASEKKALGVKVVSPLAGIVLKDLVEGDNFITNGKDLMRVAQMDAFIVRGKVDELDLSQISVGQEVEVTCDAFAGTVMKGLVNWIGAQAGDSTFADIPVVIDLIDTKGLGLKPNISAEAKIIVGKIPQAVVIPAGAVRKKSAGSFVLKASKAGWLTERLVDVKRVNSDQVVVQKGLAVGDTILVPAED